MARDWYAWHADYADPTSSLSRRLTEVRRQVGAALDRAPAGPLRVLSLCAGQGRDLLPVLADHPRRGDVTARLVEWDPRNAELAAGWYAAEGFELLALTGPEVDSAVGVHRFTGRPAPLPAGATMFGFVDSDELPASDHPREP